jgi:hypothetical protein
MMNLLRSLLVVILSLLGTGTPDRLESDGPALFAAKTLRCTFAEAYAVTIWRSGRPQLGIDQDKGGQNFVLEAMDFKAHTARMVATNNPLGGAAEVQIWQTPGGLHMLETPLGGFILTTISELKTTDGFVAATSRHTAGLGIFLPQQYYGTCAVVE